ncbi:MAG: hypothetical protein F6K31_10895, partial [Symploca sp. SIO2G7]|nr:hypothetical protein [Symploca sp. SIO2G7]
QFPHSPFPIPHSPFPIPNSPFPIPHSPFPKTLYLINHEKRYICELLSLLPLHIGR